MSDEKHRLYVANPTKQHHEFTYRSSVGPKAQVRQMTIRYGAQVVLPEEFSSEQVDAIVKHHQVYGAAMIDDLRSHKGRMVSLIFSVDRPVPNHRIQELFEANKGVLSERGRQFRQSGAIVVNQEIQKQMDEQGIPGNIKDFAMEIVQEEPKGGYPDEEKPIGEGYNVVKEGEAPAPKPKRGRV